MRDGGQGEERAFPSTARAVGQVRSWAMQHARAGGASADAVGAVQLAMSEVYTNAVDHAPGAATVVVRVSTAPGAVTFEVDDERDAAPRRRTGRAGLPGGHGLHILDQVTADWGFRARRSGGKVVWFTVRW